MKNVFMKVPNLYIRNDIESKFSLNRKFYIVYLLIDMHRSRAGISWLTISQIHKFYGITGKEAMSNISKEVIGVLRYMAMHKMIEITGDLDNIKYDSAIEILICEENFEPLSDFTIVYIDMLEFITHSSTGQSRENLLIVMLYMLSFIYYRDVSSYSEKETGFWRSIENTAKDTGLSKNTIRKCMDILASPQSDRDALFYKKKLDRMIDWKRMPNVFVLKEGDYENRINRLINQLNNDFGGTLNE